MSLVNDLRLQAARGGIRPPADGETCTKYPNVWALVTQDRYDDDTQRFLAEIKINRVDGAYQVAIDDHETCQRKTCLVRSWATILDELELCLVDPEVPWVAFKSYRNPLGLKRHDKKKT